MRIWTVGVSFNKFDKCLNAHGKMAVCSGCRPHMGVYHATVGARTTHAAMALALLDFPRTEWGQDGYEVVAVDVDPLSDVFLPRRASSDTPRRRPARKATSAKKTSGARGRGGKGRRRA